MKKNNFINKWLDENQDPKIEAKVKAEAEELIRFAEKFRSDQLNTKER